MQTTVTDDFTCLSVMLLYCANMAEWIEVVLGWRLSERCIYMCESHFLPQI